jgi:DNA-binding NarL/FixJ family response regulator
LSIVSGMRACAELDPHSPIDLADRSVTMLVLDQHAASRIGLGVMLRRQACVARCLLASDVDEAVELTRRFKPDAAIVDISNAGPFIGSYIGPLRATRAAMPVLLSSHCRLPVRPSLSAVGASGLLTAGFTVEELIGAVSAVLVRDDEPWLSESNHLEGLSEREREVLVLISTGATNREIAAVMHVGAETVKKHAGALYRKLGVRNRTEAAQRAAQLLQT